MPSTRRFASLRDSVRNHPAIVASSAASVGVLLGAFVAIHLAMPHQRADTAVAPQAAPKLAAEAKPAVVKPAVAKPASETTGSAPTGDRTASVDCERQTWPYLSRFCIEELKSKNRTRVISTDKLDKSTISAIEASPRPPVESKPAPAVANTAAASPSPAAAELAAAPSAVFSAPERSPSAMIPPATVTSAAPPPSQPAANVEGKKEKRVATKSKRKSRAESKALAKQDSDDDEVRSTAADDSDDRASDDRRDRWDRRERRVDRRQVTERWTERNYDVPADDGDGQRRVTVIRRGGGGLFEDLFGD